MTFAEIDKNSLHIDLHFARAQHAGDPYAFHFESQDYTLTINSGAITNALLTWDHELLSDIKALRQEDIDPVILQRIGERLRRFLNALEWQIHEAAIEAAVRRGESVIVTIRAAAAELYALPWELATITSTGQHLGGLPRVLLRYEWPGLRPAGGVPHRGEGRLLLAWSAAAGAVPASEHIQALRSASATGQVIFDPQTDIVNHVSLHRLVDALEFARDRGAPVTTLHLLCHGGAIGNTYGLALHGDEPDGRPVIVDARRLEQALQPFIGQIRLIVLMACDSSNPGTLGNQLGSIAQCLHRAGFAIVLSSRYPLSFVGSVLFSQQFYQSLLGNSRSVESSFLSARLRLVADAERHDWLSLQLYARAGDGSQTQLVARRSNVQPTSALILEPERQSLAPSLSQAQSPADSLAQPKTVGPERTTARRSVEPQSAPPLQPGDQGAVHPLMWIWRQVRSLLRRPSLDLVGPLPGAEAGGGQPPGEAYNRAWYVSRPAKDEEAFLRLSTPGSPAVIYGPTQFGKTWFLQHLLQTFRARRQAQIVQVWLSDFSGKELTTLRRFLRGLGERLCKGCELPLEWAYQCLSKQHLESRGFEELMVRLLRASRAKELVVAIDGADEIHRLTVRDHFYRLLRVFAERASTDQQTFGRLRIALCISTTPEALISDPTTSPFNLAPPIQLEELAVKQIKQLQQRYELSWTDADTQAVIALVGGHPYLLRLLMYHAARDRAPLKILLSPDNEIFSQHIVKIKKYLKANPELLDAMQQLKRHISVKLEITVYYRLHKAGLVDRRNNREHIRCALYESIVE